MRHRLAALIVVLALAGCAGMEEPSTVSPSPSPSPSPTVEVRLAFTGLESKEGAVVVAVYADQASFEQGEGPVRSATLPIAGDPVRWSLELAPGAYAVKAFHDGDGDGDLDRGSFGQPIEPYGFSNDARGTMGPPGWSEARFSVEGADVSLAVRLR